MVCVSESTRALFASCWCQTMRASSIRRTSIFSRSISSRSVVVAVRPVGFSLMPGIVADWGMNEWQSRPVAKLRGWLPPVVTMIEGDRKARGHDYPT